MKYDIIKDPMSMLEVQMNNGESITAESGALVYMKGNIVIKTRTREGFLKSLKVKALGGESFFVNDYAAQEDGCTLGLTGPPVGDIMHIPISNGNGYIVQSGAYIASTTGVDIDTKWQGFTKGLFGSEFFMLKVTGSGDMFVNAYGGIINKQLGNGEKMVLDNYHLVALSENASYKVTKLQGMKTTVLGGEGLVTEITGPGSIYFQTKNLKELIDLLGIRNRQETSGPTVNIGGFKFGT
ncbi:MAG: uncharacterized protein (TIGR00266 family) [Candidatus Nitrosomirales archaeon]|jgi:uncharacterized protein (TIGR00266 family)